MSETWLWIEQSERHFKNAFVFDSLVVLCVFADTILYLRYLFYSSIFLKIGSCDAPG